MNPYTHTRGMYSLQENGELASAKRTAESKAGKTLSIWSFVQSVCNSQISSFTGFAAVLFLASFVGAMALVGGTNMVLNTDTVSSEAHISQGQVMGVASYGYNQPVCGYNTTSCINYQLVGYSGNGWQVRIDYKLQAGITGTIKVNSWPFMDNITGSGSGYTGYDLIPNQTYNFVLYRKIGTRLVQITNVSITAPAKPKPVCQPAPTVLPVGCVIQRDQNGCYAGLSCQPPTYGYTAPTYGYSTKDFSTGSKTLIQGWLESLSVSGSAPAQISLNGWAYNNKNSLNLNIKFVNSTTGVAYPATTSVGPYRQDVSDYIYRVTGSAPVSYGMFTAAANNLPAGSYYIVASFGGQNGNYGYPFNVIGNMQQNLTVYNPSAVSLTISSVSGTKDVYVPSEQINLAVNTVINPGGTPASSQQGYNVQYRIYDANNNGYSSGNGSFDPSSGLWSLSATAPTNTSNASKIYSIDVVLYCSNSLICGGGSAAPTQVTKTLGFSVSSSGSTGTSSTIKIISPAGGEQWAVGSTQAISWVPSTTAGGPLVIALYNSSGSSVILAASAPNTGSFSWNIGSNIPVGIYAVSVSGPQVCTNSYPANCSGAPGVSQPFRVVNNFTSSINISTSDPLVLTQNVYGKIGFTALAGLPSGINPASVYSFTETGGVPGMVFDGAPCNRGAMVACPAIMSTNSIFLDGTPTAAGTFPITITARDQSGNVGTQSFTVTVNGVPTSIPQLVVGLNPSASSSLQLTPGAVSQKVASFVISAPNSSSANITSMTLGATRNTIGNNFQNLRLVISSSKTQIGSTQAVFAANGSYAFSFGSPLVIPAGASVAIDAYIDVSSAVTSANFGVSNQNLVSLNAIIGFWSSNNAINVSPLLAGQFVTLLVLPGASNPVIATLSPTSPVAQNVVSGSTNQPIAVYNLASSYSPAIVQEMDFQVAGTNSNVITSVVINGVTFPVLNGLVSATGLHISVSANSSEANVVVLANYANATNNFPLPVSFTLNLVQLKYTVYDVAYQPTVSVVSNKMTMLAAAGGSALGAATVSASPSSPVSRQVAMGSSQIVLGVYQFAETSGKEAVKIQSVTFTGTANSIGTTFNGGSSAGYTFSNFSLYANGAQVGSTLGSWNAPTNSSSNQYSLNFTGLNYIIPANSNVTLTLKADVNSWINGAASNSVWKFGVTAASMVGNSSGAAITPSLNSPYSNTVTVLKSVMVLSSAASVSSPVPVVVNPAGVRGSSEVVGIFNVAASPAGDVVVKSLTLQQNGSALPSGAVGYYIYDASNGLSNPVASGSLSGNGNSNMFYLSMGSGSASNGVFVPAGQTKSFVIKSGTTGFGAGSYALSIQNWSFSDGASTVGMSGDAAPVPSVVSKVY